jgi:NAD(P)-dependent dehydrogenase (short-subunit alcohol dehydrogenase family)
MSLKGRIAIVSGGAGDIGGESALEIARRGADVAIGDLVDRATASERVSAIEALGRRCHFTQVDVSDPDRVVDWVDEVGAALGRPDIAVATAAVVTP